MHIYLVRPKANSLTPAHRLAHPPPGLTCDVQVEGDLLAPGLTAVLPCIRLARLLHHQPPPAARGLHTHFRARTQLLAVLVPCHLRLGLGHLAAQRGAGSCHGLHVAACRLLLGKHHRGLWGQRGMHRVRDPTSVRTAAPGQRRPEWGGGPWGGGKGHWSWRLSGSAPAPCSAEVSLRFSATSHTFMHSPCKLDHLAGGPLEKTGLLHTASAGSRGKCSLTFLDGGPVFPVWLCRELLTCSPQRCQAQHPRLFMLLSTCTLTPTHGLLFHCLRNGETNHLYHQDWVRHYCFLPGDTIQTKLVGRHGCIPSLPHEPGVFPTVLRNPCSHLQ